jgi:subfamily B ATP-binding cassette protein MsbA
VVAGPAVPPGSSAAVFTTLLAQILEPATNDLLSRTPKPGTLIVIMPLTIVGLWPSAAQSSQVTQATLVNRIGHAARRRHPAVQLFRQAWCGPTWPACARRHSGSFVSSGAVRRRPDPRGGFTSGVVNYTQNALIVLGA